MYVCVCLSIGFFTVDSFSFPRGAFIITLCVPLYEIKCGLPKGNATQTAPGLWSREFANYSVTLDQYHAKYSISRNGELVSSSE